MRKAYYECKMFMSLNLCFTEEVYCYEFVSLIYNGMCVIHKVHIKKNKKIIQLDLIIIIVCKRLHTDFELLVI